MAAKYRKVDPRIWSDEKFIGLDAIDKLIAIYILTSNQCNRIGLFRFSCALAAEDIGTLPPTLPGTLPPTFPERVEKVCNTFGWGWDATRRVVFLSSWWKYNPPENPNVLISCLHDLDDLPQTPLLDEFFGNLEHLSETLQATLRKRYPQRYPEPMAHQEQEQEQEQEQDKKSKNAAPQLSIPPSLNTESFLAKWEEWLAYRASKRKKVSHLAAEKQLAELAEWGESFAIQAIDASIRSDWQGLFDPREKKSANGKPASKSMGERVAARMNGGAA